MHSFIAIRTNCILTSSHVYPELGPPQAVRPGHSSSTGHPVNVALTAREAHGYMHKRNEESECSRHDWGSALGLMRRATSTGQIHFAESVASESPKCLRIFGANCLRSRGHGKRVPPAF